MYKIYPRDKETTSKKESKMFSTPIMSRIINIVCPAAPIKTRVEYPTAIIIDNGKLHEIIIHPRYIFYYFYTCVQDMCMHNTF